MNKQLVAYFDSIPRRDSWRCRFGPRSEEETIQPDIEIVVTEVP